MNRFGVSKESFLNFATSKDADKGLVLISIPRCIRHLDRDRIISISISQPLPSHPPELHQGLRACTAMVLVRPKHAAVIRTFNL
jgi:hypothetical protein